LCGGGRTGGGDVDGSEGLLALKGGRETVQERYGDGDGAIEIIHLEGVAYDVAIFAVGIVYDVIVVCDYGPRHFHRYLQLCAVAVVGPVHQ